VLAAYRNYHKNRRGLGATCTSSLDLQDLTNKILDWWKLYPEKAENPVVLAVAYALWALKPCQLSSIPANRQRSVGERLAGADVPIQAVAAKTKRETQHFAKLPLLVASSPQSSRALRIVPIGQTLQVRRNSGGHSRRELDGSSAA
jgi:hypothetical protein